MKSVVSTPLCTSHVVKSASHALHINFGVVICHAVQRVGLKVDLDDSTLAPVSGDSKYVSSLIPTVFKREDPMIAMISVASHGKDTHAFSIPGLGSDHLNSDCYLVVRASRSPIFVKSVVSLVSTPLCTSHVVKSASHAL